MPDKEQGWFDKYLSKPIIAVGGILVLITAGYSLGAAHKSLQYEDEKNSREIAYQKELQKQIADCEKEKQEYKTKEMEDLRNDIVFIMANMKEQPLKEKK